MNFLDKEKGEQLIEMKEILNTLNDDPDSYRLIFNSEIRIEDCLDAINKHPIFKDIKEEAINRFWDMFIVDCYIGNPDRNNGNWGVIVDKNNKSKLAPIFDNGNSLSEKWGPSRIESFFLADEKEKLNIAMNIPSIYINRRGHKLNPSYLILNKELGKDFEDAIKRIVPRIKDKEQEINNMIEETPMLDDKMKIFYQSILSERLNKVLIPAHEKVINKENTLHDNDK